MVIRVNNRNSKFKAEEKNIKFLCGQIIKSECKSENIELDVSIVDDEEIAQLNEQYLSHQGATDVLAFPQDIPASADNHIAYMDEDIILGDVVVSADHAADNCANFNNTLNQEFGLYLIHGILHLLGYDDKEESTKTIMEKRQAFWFDNFLKDGTLNLIAQK